MFNSIEFQENLETLITILKDPENDSVKFKVNSETKEDDICFITRELLSGINEDIFDNEPQEDDIETFFNIIENYFEDTNYNMDLHKPTSLKGSIIISLVDTYEQICEEYDEQTEIEEE